MEYGDCGTLVEALDPRAIAGMAGRPALTAVASEAAARIGAALHALQDDRPPGVTSA